MASWPDPARQCSIPTKLLHPLMDVIASVFFTGHSLLVGSQWSLSASSRYKLTHANDRTTSGDDCLERCCGCKDDVVPLYRLSQAGFKPGQSAQLQLIHASRMPSVHCPISIVKGYIVCPRPEVNSPMLCTLALIGDMTIAADVRAK
jgi:hypothetical protein